MLGHLVFSNFDLDFTRCFSNMQGEMELNNAQLFPDFFESVKCFVEVGGVVAGRHLGADAGLVFGDDRVGKADDVKTFGEEAAGHFGGEFSVIEHDGDDGMRAGNEFEAEFFHATSEIGGVLAKFFAEVIARFDHVENFEGCRCDDRCKSVGEKIGTRALTEQFDHLFAS